MEDNSSSTFLDVETAGIEFGFATDDKLVVVDEDNNNATGACDGGGKQRMIWTEADNLRLVNAWLNNAIDSNSKKSEMYWKNVVKEYNENDSTSLKLKKKQLKDHWAKMNKKVKCFHGAWARVKEIYCSDQSDDQLMSYDELVTKAENLYKDEMGSTFSLKYWWEVVKNQPKWIRMYEMHGKNKRTKLCELGSYALSQGRESEDVEINEDIRPQGQKAVNAARKKGKEKIQTSSEEMSTFHDTQTPKSYRSEKLAMLQLQTSENKLNEKKIKLELYDRYEKLQSIDVSALTDLQKEQHQKKMLFLEKELFDV